ncbi:hypothetical protein BOX15_Mlig012060g1, partial [Macrostomum lignano]
EASFYLNLALQGLSTSQTGAIGVTVFSKFHKMPEKKPRTSTSSDVSFIHLGEVDDLSAGRGSRCCQGRACAGFAGVAAVSLLIALALLCLVLLGKVCVRHGQDGGLWPSSVGLCGRRDLKTLPLYINLAIEFNKVPACQEPLSTKMRLPCSRKRQYLTGNSAADAVSKLGDKLGPLACRDDAYLENGGRDNCKHNRFHLAYNDTGVIIPVDGVYRVHSTISFVDTLDYYVSAIVRVDPADCVKDPVCSASELSRDRRAHAWLSCANHNGGAKKGNSFTSCTIDGVRRFNRGDVVSFSVTQQFRSINPFHKSTQFFIHKI